MTTSGCSVNGLGAGAVMTDLYRSTTLKTQKNLKDDFMTDRAAYSLWLPCAQDGNTLGMIRAVDYALN